MLAYKIIYDPMNKAIQLLIYISFFIVSCSQKKTNKDFLIQIDSLTYHDPDSAILCLHNLSDSMNNVSLDIQMYYKLLTIKANDKAFIKHTSDSLVLSVVSYYEKTKDIHHLAEVYYYAGRVYADLYDAPRGLNYYQKAIEAFAEKHSSRLLGVIYSQMGDLLLYQNVYDEAMEAYKKSYNYNILIGDKIGEVVNLCSIGETFTGYGNADSALFYFNKANQKVLQIDNLKLKDWVQLELASLYNQLNEFDSVKVLLNDYISVSNTNFLITSADMYYGINQLDSASYYYNKVIEKNEMYTSQRAHLKLAEIAMARGDAEAALEHTRKYKEWTTEIAQATNTETVHKMHSYYNYQLREKENNRLRLENIRQEKWIVACCSAILLLGCFIVAYYQYSRRKRTLLHVQLEKLEQLKEEQYRKSTHFIEENKQKIEALEQQLQQHHRENDDMQKLLLAQKEQIRQMNERIKTDLEERELSENLFRRSEIYSKFHEAVGNEAIKLSPQDWETLRLKIDECYKGFTLRLRSIYSISDMELKICLLLKIGVGVTGIALLCGRTKSAIVSARKRLYEKFFAQKGRPEDWDEFILSL